MSRPGPWFWPLAVGAVSLAFTAWQWQHERETQALHLRSSFDAGLRQTAARVEQRIASYEQMLRGVRGLFDASTEVTAADFAAYVDTLAAGADFAGLRSIAFAPARRGAGGEEQAPLAFAAPAAGLPLAAPGLDLLADPVQRAAMQQARDSGHLAVTQRLGDPPAFGLVMPLYRPGQAQATAAARAAALRGWVIASFGIAELMSSLYGEGVAGLEVQVFEGVRPEASARLFPPAVAAEATHRAAFESQEYIAFGGRTWTLLVRSTPGFEQRYGSDAPGLIALAGGGFSLLLALLTWQLVTGRERAAAAARAMTQQARESAERYRRIVETAAEGIWLLDAEGRTAFANPKLRELLGCDEAALLGQPWTAFMDEPSRAAVAGRTGGGGGGGSGPLELQFLRADGSTLCATVSTSPLPEGAGTLAMVTDVTARRQAEAGRQVLEDQLRQLQKMEAVGTLAGGIAHDFNNLLAAILGNTELLRQDLAEGRQAPQRLEQIRRAAERGRSLVQQIVTFSRQQPQERVVLALQPVVAETAALLRSTLPSGVTLELRQAATPIRISANATQLQQVLLNLCTNAWHAMPDGRGRIVIELQADAAQACLAVSDDGSGMDEATRSRIFEPFYTTKPVGRGTGLGLSVVHGIVSAHGGSITVSSTPGLGSRFEMRFPLAAEAAPEAPAAAPEGATPRGSGEQVLYVDDDPVMAPVVQALLERQGYRVSCLDDPAQALALALGEAARFDIVVTDYNMPGLSGLALARELQRQRPALPVIISSGYVTEALRADARAAGVRHVLQKEYTLEQLPALIGRTLADAGR